MKQSIQIVVFFFALAYMTGMFINADFNIAKWSEESRSVIGGCYAFVIVFSVAVSAMHESTKQVKP